MRTLLASTTCLALLAACGGDDGGGGIDADLRDFDAPNADAANPDGPSPVDAMLPDGPAPAMINDCTEAAALDRTELADQREVNFPGFAYAPKCMKIKVGQTVTWSGDLAFHPLRAGTIVNNVRTPQAGNPIPSTSSGNTVSVTFAAAGAWGYYCNAHWASGMKGAIYVVP